MKEKTKTRLGIGALILLLSPIIIAVVFGVVVFSSLLFYGTLRYLPSKSFYKAFSEYYIAIEELKRIEVGDYDPDRGEFIMRTLSDEDAIIYLEKLLNEKVRLNWLRKLRKVEFERDYDFKAVFYKTDGTKAELYLSYEGNPLTDQRINDTYYYCKPGNRGLLPQTYNWEA